MNYSRPQIFFLNIPFLRKLKREHPVAHKQPCQITIVPKLTLISISLKFVPEIVLFREHQWRELIC